MAAIEVFVQLVICTLRDNTATPPALKTPRRGRVSRVMQRAANTKGPATPTKTQILSTS